MSEAIKLRRFSHKALFHVLVITVNYKQQENGWKMQKEKWVYSVRRCFFSHPVGTLIISSLINATRLLPEIKPRGVDQRRLFTSASMCEYMRPPFISQGKEKLNE